MFLFHVYVRSRFLELVFSQCDAAQGDEQRRAFAQDRPRFELPRLGEYTGCRRFEGKRKIKRIVRKNDAWGGGRETKKKMFFFVIIR